MRDYDITQLKKNDPRLYVEKMLTYGIFHDMKIEKQLVKRYIDQVHIPDHIREFILFLLQPLDETSHPQHISR